MHGRHKNVKDLDAIIPQTEGSIAVKELMVEMYNAHVAITGEIGSDLAAAYYVKVLVANLINEGFIHSAHANVHGITASIVTDFAKRIKANPQLYSAENLEHALRELENNAHFIFHAMAELMTLETITVAEAAEKLTSILSGEHSLAMYLFNGIGTTPLQARLAEVGSMTNKANDSRRHISLLERFYVLNPLRLDAARLLIDTERNTPMEAFEKVCKAAGDELRLIVEKAKSEKRIQEEADELAYREVLERQDKEDEARWLIKSKQLLPKASNRPAVNQVELTSGVAAPATIDYINPNQLPFATQALSYVPLAVVSLVVVAGGYACRNTISSAANYMCSMFAAKPKVKGSDDLEANNSQKKPLISKTW